MKKHASALSALFGEWGSTHVLGVVRIGLGLLLLFQAVSEARDQVHGYFGDRFHMPYVPESFVPSSTVFGALLGARILAALLVVTGHAARPALAASAIALGHSLVLDRLRFHHHEWTLACIAFLVALTPCDESLSLVAADEEGPPPRGPLWAVRLAQVQISLIYLASGGSKLLDDDWRGGLVLLDRMTRYGGDALAKGVPEGVIHFFQDPSVASALAKLAIGTELFLVVGLWLPRTRAVALWIGVMFHLTIELTSKVSYFSWLMILAYALFATHDLRARSISFDPSHRSSAIVARVARTLDWLARFRVKAWSPDGLAQSHHLVVRDRDGQTYTGFAAAVALARCLPLLFPLWVPLALVFRFTQKSDDRAPD
ncbi:hypothetical protein BH09MYX1_BH09MYX1_32570 [soil metagenome]